MNGGGYDVSRSPGRAGVHTPRSLAKRQSGTVAETEDPRCRRLQSWSTEPEKCSGPAHRCMTSALLDPCATALDQNDQHDHEQHAGSNPDNRGSVHVKFSLLF